MQRRRSWLKIWQNSATHAGDQATQVTVEDDRNLVDAGTRLIRCRIGVMPVRTAAAAVACLGVLGVSGCGGSVQSCGTGDYGARVRVALRRLGRHSDMCSPPTRGGCRCIAGWSVRVRLMLYYPLICSDIVAEIFCALAGVWLARIF